MPNGDRYFKNEVHYFPDIGEYIGEVDSKGLPNGYGFNITDDELTVIEEQYRVHGKKNGVAR